ncbi:acetyl-CoA carboxylase biotin carboxyl carrier protein [Palleronia aestuarii]|uniref:Biotin carboxyl carrier protein of acetyl-CoA carboxylase n=1 Tax=Palleronia aestuarii TaxID=568105 RepID=A0A2W7NH73_9RHOB|nr:acetyl-CoA carboxylase biotin carboxyl carrier protein subunit [Palleronia aestuarii]PZX19771.1 acetyl-CoA carboxylase biotin carboxyl carrier protein [Palleronia aestuarii]
MSDNPHESDVAFIQALAELLRENDLTELRVKREYGEADSLDVRVSRGGPVAAPMPVYARPAHEEDEVRPAAPSVESLDDPSRHPGAVTSPMVGTAYLSPEPGAMAFVKPGDEVAEGQTLLIIEAMKTMNHIPSPRAGRVKSILIEDGAPVEFSAPLMILE